MKIIISHDVDHLYPSDHIFRDLIFPKLWVRSFFQMLKGEIGFSSFWNRLISIFDNRLNRITEMVEFDRKHGIPSVFFFGMDNILGLSYKKEKAEKWIRYVLDSGLDAGVHGIDFENVQKMQKEYDDFKKMSGLTEFGIRTHYVRYNDTTFKKMEEVGYLFDTSLFNKKEIGLDSHYRINNMWEFPLQVMDGYVIHNNFEKAKADTIQALEKAENKGLEYFSLLFHDYRFNDKTYPIDKKYYEWFVKFCIEKKLPFVSYKQAVKVLNEK